MLPDRIEVRESPTRQSFCLHQADGGATIYARWERPDSVPHEAAEALYFTGLARALAAAGIPTAKIQRWREEAFCCGFTAGYLEERRAAAEPGLGFLTPDEEEIRGWLR